LDALKETLRIFRIGLTIGLIDRETWLTWLKTTVAREKKPAPELVALTTLDPKAPLFLTFNLLDPLLGPKHSGHAARVIMRMIYDALQGGKITATKAVQLAYHASTEAHQTEAEQAYLSSLDDEGYLIQLGAGRREEKAFEAEISTFLSQFKDYPLPQ
jgi:hypothetical protein